MDCVPWLERRLPDLELDNARYLKSSTKKSPWTSITWQNTLSRMRTSWTKIPFRSLPNDLLTSLVLQRWSILRGMIYNKSREGSNITQDDDHPFSTTSILSKKTFCSLSPTSHKNLRKRKHEIQPLTPSGTAANQCNLIPIRTSSRRPSIYEFNQLRHHKHALLLTLPEFSQATTSTWHCPTLSTPASHPFPQASPIQPILHSETLAPLRSCLRLWRYWDESPGNLTATFPAGKICMSNATWLTRWVRWGVAIPVVAMLQWVRRNSWTRRARTRVARKRFAYNRQQERSTVTPPMNVTAAIPDSLFSRQLRRAVKLSIPMLDEISHSVRIRSLTRRRAETTTQVPRISCLFPNYPKSHCNSTSHQGQRDCIWKKTKKN